VLAAEHRQHSLHEKGANRGSWMTVAEEFYLSWQPRQLIRTNEVLVCNRADPDRVVFEIYEPFT